ncbi:polysaccharide deacetylase [Siminovitchia sediminis]|uniref:Polysaccharide deacetylase n=1 Tax=Siminovitchia sediminis TaxID=1274353 RepID=A0ABW4KLM3_9BACI
MIKNPITWPNGKRCAVAITFDEDSDSLVHLDYPDNAGSLVSTTSWLRYGTEVGIPRILEMYRKYEIKQTFFIPAWVIERNPWTVEQILRDGHEIAHHGYMHEHPYKQTREDELYWLQRGAEVIKKFTGKHPTGYRAPWFAFSENTADLLAQEGFLYDSSLMEDDVPYVLNSKSGRLIELPTDWSQDDYPQYVHNDDFNYVMQIASPDRAMEVFLANFDAAWEYGGLWVSVWHPFNTGRPARLRKVEQMIEYMQEKGDVWFATMEEIALHVKKCIDDGSYKPREVNLPYYEGRIPETTKSEFARSITKQKLTTNRGI